jgi:hypothetical protein
LHEEDSLVMSTSRLCLLPPTVSVSFSSKFLNFISFPVSPARPAWLSRREGDDAYGFGAATDGQRLDARFHLMRRLYRRGFKREDVVRLYRFLEWIMKLPRDLELVLRERIEAELEGKIRMPYLSTIERIAMEKGEEKGLEKGREKGREEGREGLRAGIRLGLKLRFGDAGLALLPALEEIKDLGRLRSLLDALERIERIEEFRALLSAS